MAVTEVVCAQWLCTGSHAEGRVGSLKEEKSVNIQQWTIAGTDDGHWLYNNGASPCSPLYSANEISGQLKDMLIERLTEWRDPRTKLLRSSRSWHEYGKLDYGVRGRGRIATATLHSIACTLTRPTPPIMPSWRCLPPEWRQISYCPRRPANVLPNITRYRCISPNTQYPDTGIVRTLPTL